jgi:hypothetical protein
MLFKLLFQFAVFGLISVFISSCKSDNTNDRILSELAEGLQTNNIRLLNSNKDVLAALQLKANDMRTKEKASILLPRAEEIQTLSTGLTGYFDSLRLLVADTIGRYQPLIHDAFIGNDIHRNLVNYKGQIFAIHPKLKNDLGELINRLLFNKDVLLPANEYQQKYYRNLSRKELLSLLSLLENRALMVANVSLQWFNDQVTFHGEHFESFEAILGQNAQVLEAGNELEITAGLGTFNSRNNPKITVNGQLVPLNKKGFAVYKIKTSKKSGAYSLPVLFEFIDEEGKEQRHTFNVEYRLVESIEN